MCYYSMSFFNNIYFMENIYIQGWLEVLIDFSHFSAVFANTSCLFSVVSQTQI